VALLSASREPHAERIGPDQELEGRRLVPEHEDVDERRHRRGGASICPRWELLQVLLQGFVAALPSTMRLAVPPEVTGTRRGFACSATGIVMVRTPRS